MNGNRQVLETSNGPNLVVRALWYLLVGWWLTAFAMALAWIAAIVIVGLPLTFWLVNRIPTFLTLRPRRQRYVATTDASGVIRYEKQSTEQSGLLVRAVWFILVGGRASLAWMVVAYFFMLTIIGIPLGLMMVELDCRSCSACTEAMHEQRDRQPDRAHSPGLGRSARDFTGSVRCWPRSMTSSSEHEDTARSTRPRSTCSRLCGIRRAHP